MLKLSGLRSAEFFRLPKPGEQAIRSEIMSQRYPANLNFDPDIIRLMIPLNCALCGVPINLSLEILLPLMYSTNIHIDRRSGI
jgi:hypothetical protein